MMVLIRSFSAKEEILNLLDDIVHHLPCHPISRTARTRFVIGNGNGPRFVLALDVGVSHAAFCRLGNGRFPGVGCLLPAGCIRFRCAFCFHVNDLVWKCKTKMKTSENKTSLFLYTQD